MSNHQVYAETLLHSGREDCISLAGQMLRRSLSRGLETQAKDPLIGPRIKYDKSVELVLGAAKEYFNSSNDLSDNVMDLARFKILFDTIWVYRYFRNRDISFRIHQLRQVIF